MKATTSLVGAFGALLTLASLGLIALPFSLLTEALFMPLLGATATAFTLLIAIRDYAPRLSYRTVEVASANGRANERLPFAA
jgi:hypothetical protein